MMLKYFYDKALAHASYLVGCQKTGEAILIDPDRNIEPYLEAARREGMKIVGTCLLYTSPSPRDRQKSRMPSSA